MQSTAEFHDQIADPFFPQANPVFDDAAALGTAVDMVDPQPTLVELLVRHVLLPRERLPQIGINSEVLHPITVVGDGAPLRLEGLLIGEHRVLWQAQHRPRWACTQPHPPENDDQSDWHRSLRMLCAAVP